MDKITSSEIKKNNRKNIYMTIYNQGQISKQQLADSLQLSMPTVTHNLKGLEEQHLIQKDGFFSSSASGGRKAQIISCNRTAKIAIGMEVLVECVNIVATDLYGVPLSRDTLTIPFECSNLYYCAVGNWVNSFIISLPYPAENVLGVGISMQGLVSEDHRKMIYGEILHCTGLTLDEFSSYIKYPCIFIHDTEAAAFTEIWQNQQVQDTLFILINKTMGGALIVDGKIHNSSGRISGAIEHMCLIPDGKPCYCGRRGCVESYCSLNAILREAGMSDIRDFFTKMRSGDAELTKIWKEYLLNLARAINNSIRIIDCDIVMSGQISSFLTDEDIRLLEQYVEEFNSFSFHKRRIRLGSGTKDIAAVGAALYLISDFFEQDPAFQ